MPVLKLTVPNCAHSIRYVPLRSIASAAQTIRDYAARWGIATCAVDYSVAIHARSAA